jgi:hypothetical protein
MHYLKSIINHVLTLQFNFHKKKESRMNEEKGTYLFRLLNAEVDSIEKLLRKVE